MKSKLIFGLFIYCFCYSCNTFLCGELTGEWKQQFENANSKAIKFKIENIPCEYFYINLIMLSNEIDTSSIRSIHKILYNKENRIGWQVIKVYDNNRKYLFSHNYNDNIYIQTGD